MPILSGRPFYPLFYRVPTGQISRPYTAQLSIIANLHCQPISRMIFAKVAPRNQDKNQIIKPNLFVTVGSTLR